MAVLEEGADVSVVALVVEVVPSRQLARRTGGSFLPDRGAAREGEDVGEQEQEG